MDEKGNQDSVNNRQVSWITADSPQPSLASDLTGPVSAVYSVARFPGLSL